MESIKHLFFLSLFGAITLFSSQKVVAQIAVDNSPTAQQLAEILAGPNITVTNATITGGGAASGSFAGTNSDVGFDSGVILSTGDASSSSGPNDVTNSTEQLGTPGTTQMTSLAGATSYDAITLEFDFEVQSSSIQFNYVFASEEYPEYAPPNNSSYNDVFAFYISGPGITGEENIALVPNSTNAVAINNINPVNNSQYYVDNTGGQDIQFDGFTTILEAKRNNLTACEVYHLKLVIADVGDEQYNSAVFLQENSLIQGTVNVETQTINADDIALEGCIPASFTFSFDEASNQDRIISFTVGGDAVNGVDYQFLDSTMTIVAGDTSATIFIDAFSDGITEGQESVWIIYQPAACSELDTAYLYIDDAQPIDFTLDEFHLDCFEDNSGEIQVNATGGFPPYNFEVTHPDGSSTNEMSNPITGLSAGTYSVQVYDSYGCQAEALVIGGVYDADTTFLPDVPNGQVETYDAPLDIQGFNTGQTITDVSQIQQICLTMEHSYLGDLEIAVESPSGETIILKSLNGGGSTDLGEPIATAPVDGQASSTLTDPGSGYEYCFNANPIYGTMISEAGNFTRDYTDGQGNNYQDSYLPAGSYTSEEDFSGLVGSDMNGTWTVHVTDQFGLDNGYIFNWYISLIGDMPDTLVTILEPDDMILSDFVTDATCGGNDGSINLNIQDGIAPYTIAWSNGETTQNLSNVSAGTYTVTVTDASGCVKEQTFIVNNIGSLDATVSSQPTSCFGSSDGSTDVTITGGTSPYSYSWSNGATTEDLSAVPAGEYIVTITDGQGCLISEAVTVNDAQSISISANSINNEECSTDNGSIDITVSGGSGSYGYQWSNGASSQDISNLTSNVYTVDVVDGNGCMAQESFTIVNDLSNCSAFCYIEIQENALADENCGNGNGSISIDVLNAVAPMSYSWSNGATTQNISGLSAGDYTVVVTDANNCTEVATFTVDNNTGNLAITNANVTAENCGNANGAIDITVTGGAMPYSFSWDNGATTEDISSLSAGLYIATVTDANGCSAMHTYEVLNNAGTLIATANISDELCSASNGAINQVVSGGNGVLTYAWNTGATTEDISNVPAGDYQCTITDETGCYIVESYMIGQQSGDITLVGSNITNEICGNGQGAINVTLTGNNLSYSWSNGETTEDLSNLSAGNYSLTVTNLSGCSYSSPVFSVVNGSGSMNVSTSIVSDEVCSSSNGAVNINVTGGTAPYAFSWSNGSTDEDLMNVSAGLYSVTVTDANGCVETQSETVAASTGTLEILSAIVINENCGDGNGSIDINVSGTSGGETFAWSNGATTEDITGLSAGTYVVTVSDNGCETIMTYEVLNDANDLYFSNMVTNEICSNSEGSIELFPGGGNGVYTYLWSNGATTASIGSLSQGVYACVITDGNGCSMSTNDISVGNTSSTMTSTETVTDANCSSNGAIDVTINGGTAPINYSWNTGQTTEDLSSISAGVYIYTFTDADGCQLVKTVEVEEMNGGITYAVQTSNENCNDGQGSIDLSATGDVFPLTFAWSNGETTEDITGLSTGTYTCVITDPNGCTLTTNAIQISSNAGSLSIDNIIATDETCNNGLGSIDISVSGEVAPLTYAWSNGESTEDISNLSSGNYSVIITDGAGCQATTQDQVGSSSGSLAITNPIVQDESCSNGQGSIDISVSGAANPISYQWSNGETTQDISNLSAGLYYVTVTDGNGCSVIHTYAVENSGSNLSILANTISDDYCSSGSGEIAISVGNGIAPYSYVWSNGSTQPGIGNLTQGTYSVTVTDGGGCTISASYTVNNNNGNLLVNGTVIDETCGQGNGSVEVVTTGGNAPIAYSWDNGSSTEDLDPIGAGLYILTATDQYGCQSVFTAQVDNLASDLAITQDNLIDENCAQGNGAIETSISGTNIFSTVWNSGQTTEDISGLSAGEYTLTITNDQGCSLSESFTIQNQTNGLSITFSNVGNETCSNAQGFIDIEVAGTAPFSYLWSDGQTTQDAIGLTEGVYYVTITDGVGCTTVQTFTVGSDNSSNMLVTENITDAMCTSSDGSIDLVVSGGISPHSYVWSNGETTEDINNIPAGVYTVTIADAMNCSTVHTVLVQSNDTGLGFTQLDITDEFCGQGDGEVVIYTGGTADDYYINGVNNGGWLIENLSAGTHTLSISDNAGCWVDSVITIQAQAMFDVTGTTTAETCASSNGTIDITVTQGGPGGNYDFLWSNGATTEDLTGVEAGDYSVTVSTSQGPGCTMTYDFTVDEVAHFVATENIIHDDCNQSIGSIEIILSDPSNVVYDWNTGATTSMISGLSAGDYFCMVTNTVTNCVETFTYTVENFSNGMYASAVVSNDVCNSESGAIDIIPGGGSGNFDFSWSNGETTEDIAGLGAGTYTVTITDQSDNCEILLTETVANSDEIFGGSGVVTDATCNGCFDGMVDVTFSQNGLSYLWSNGETTEDIVYLDPGVYTLVATSAQGCDTTLTFTVLNTAGLIDVDFEGIEMNVHPNPANELFTIYINNPYNEKGSVQMTNSLGQLIDVYSVDGDEEIELNAKNFVNGLYFVTIETEKNRIIKRLIISNE